MNPRRGATGWSLEAPEWQAPPSLRFTGIALRTVALLVDASLWSVYWGLLLSAESALDGPVLSLLLFVPPLVYFPVAWGSVGTTAGMWLLQLRIVRATDGGGIGYGTALLRGAICLVLVVLAVVLIGIGLFALPMVTDPRRRGFHDRMAGTLVVRPAQSAWWRVVLALLFSFGLLGAVLWFILGGGGTAV
jgi:uncharacterized RDD family membrane protein YckC